MVCSLLPATTYSCMSSSIRIHIHIIGIVRGEITNIQLLINMHVHILITV